MTDEPATATTNLAFDLPGIGTVTARAEHRSSDAVVYRVAGPRVTGAFTVRPHRALEAPSIIEVRVSYGLVCDRAPALWTERPEVNGVVLLGSNLVTVDAVPRLATSDKLNPMRGANNHYGRDTAPAGATAKTRAVVAAILADYFTRPDLAELHQRACAGEALPAIEQAEGELEMIGQRLREGQAARRRVLSRLATLQVIATGGPLEGNPVELLNAR
ncbi:hypothetical protein [Nocardia asteroides]